MRFEKKVHDLTQKSLEIAAASAHIPATPAYSLARNAILIMN
jgi:hypothetical protein